MGLHSIRNREKIVEIIELLISKKADIGVRIEGEIEPFNSRIMKLSTEGGQADTGTTLGKRLQLIAEKLTPDAGNGLIQSSSKVVVEFKVGDRLLQFDTRFAGISSNYPYFGIILDFPDGIILGDTRKEERIPLSMPEFVYVEFTFKKGSERARTYRLNVLNYSSHGLGLLVTDKDLVLLDILNTGDDIRDIAFYAKWAIIKVDATVRHKTKIQEGKFKGQYILGIESSELLDNSRSEG
jgi:hypothetical protein